MSDVTGQAAGRAEPEERRKDGIADVGVCGIKALDDDDCLSRGGRHAEQAVLLIELDATTGFYLGESASRVPLGSRSTGATDSVEPPPPPTAPAPPPPLAPP